jgi:hypothetical protein
MVAVVAGKGGSGAVFDPTNTAVASVLIDTSMSFRRLSE